MVVTFNYNGKPSKIHDVISVFNYPKSNKVVICYTDAMNNHYEKSIRKQDLIDVKTVL